MQKNQASLLKTRRFLPLFLVQFLGALNDNIFKNALVILITFRAASEAGIDAPILVTLAAGIFILPFFIFSATAGQLADCHEKSGLIRKIKFAEIGIMALGGVGFWAGNIYFLLFILFLNGVQSAFFGPLKYGILPDHLRENELIGGNALVEGSTFLAILLGTIFGSLLILRENGIAIISTIVMSVAIVGYVVSRYIPKASPAVRNLGVSFNVWAETRAIMAHAARRRDVFTAILGISWFWFLGATFLAQFPNYTKIVIGGNEQVVTLFLIAFGLGIGIGSLMCNQLLKGVISARYVPLSAVAMTIFIVDLYFAMQSPAVPPTQLMGAAEFLVSFDHVRVLVDFALIAIAGGVYIVPLYALVQERSDAGHRSRAIASLNVMNAAFMVASALITVGLFAAGFDVAQVFLAVGAGNLGIALFLRRLNKA